MVVFPLVQQAANQRNFNVENASFFLVTSGLVLTSQGLDEVFTPHGKGLRRSQHLNKSVSSLHRGHASTGRNGLPSHGGATGGREEPKGAAFLDIAWTRTLSELQSDQIVGHRGHAKPVTK